MSNYDPEAPTPKNPGPNQPHPLTSGTYPPGYTYGTAQSVSPPSNFIDVDWSSVKGAIEGIAAVNQKIVEQWGSIADSIHEYEATLSRINNITISQAGGTTVDQMKRQQYVGPTSTLDDEFGSQQDLERLKSEEEQLRSHRIYAQHMDTRRVLNKFRKMNPDQQIQELTQRGILSTNESGQSGLSIGNKFITSDELKSAIGSPSDENQPILTYLNSQMRARISEEVSRKAPSVTSRILDAVEESGIRQLRFGQLQVQDILRSSGILSGRLAGRIQEGVDYQQQLAAYNARKAIAEGNGEEFTEEAPQEPTTALGRYGARRAGAGALGRVPGLGGLSTLALRLPELGQMFAAGQTLSRTILGVYGSVFNAYANPERVGQQTGQGFLAGIQAKTDAFRLGIKPWDLFSGKMAEETINTVRMMGFTGKNGQPSTMDVASGIRDVINNTGLSVQDAANFFEDALRKGGMSVDDVRTELEKFHDQARNLNMNITDYTKEILSNTQSLRSQGAGGAAPTIASALVAAVPRAYQGEGQQHLQQMFESNRGAIVGALNARGVPANIITVSGPTYAAQAYGALDQLILRDAMMARDQLRGQLGREPSTEELANYMSQVGVYTRGQDPGFLTQYLNRLNKGQGVSQQVSIQRAESRYTHQLNLLTPHMRKRLSELTPGELRAHGITKTRNIGARDAHDLFAYQDAQGHSLDQNKIVTVSQHDYSHLLSTISPDQLARMRLRVLNQFSRGTFTKDEYNMFESHLRDKNFKFAQELDKVRYDSRTGPSNKLNLPLISIELKGSASQLFALRAERQKAVNSGSIPSNTLPYKLWPNTGSSDVTP